MVTEMESEKGNLQINDGTSKIKVNKLPKSSVKEEYSVQKSNQKEQLTKIKQNNNQIKDPYLEDDKRVFFAKDQDDQHVQGEIRNSLSSKEHIIPMDGVTFTENENQKLKTIDSKKFTIKGAEYNSQFNGGTKMTLNQYKTMSGFKQFGIQKQMQQHSAYVDDDLSQKIGKRQNILSLNSESGSRMIFTSQQRKKRPQDYSQIIQHTNDASIIYSNQNELKLPNVMTSSFQAQTISQRPTTGLYSSYDYQSVNKSQQAQRTRNINKNTLYKSTESYKGLKDQKMANSFMQQSMNKSFAYQDQQQAKNNKKPLLLNKSSETFSHQNITVVNQSRVLGERNGRLKTSNMRFRNK